MALQTISTLPTAPSRSMDNDTFVAAADALVAALATLVSDVNAWSSQVPAQVSPANLSTTSTTSVTIGTGSKSLTVETGKLFVAGQWLIIASTASPTNFMIGQVTSYNTSTGAMVFNVQTTSGAGTFAAWTVGPIAAPQTNLAPRTITAGTTTGTITPDAANSDLYLILGLTGPVTIAVPSGTPAAGQKLMLAIKDNGTSRALTWNAIFKPYGSVALPSATTIGKRQYIGLIYNAVDATWDVIASAVQQ